MAEKKPKSGGFLAFLNCCGAGADDDGKDNDDSTLPAKKTKIQTPQRIPAPVAEKPCGREAASQPQTENIRDEKMAMKMSGEEEKYPAGDSTAQQVPRPIVNHEDSEEKVKPAPVVGTAINSDEAMSPRLHQQHSDSPGDTGAPFVPQPSSKPMDVDLTPADTAEVGDEIRTTEKATGDYEDTAMPDAPPIPGPIQEDENRPYQAPQQQSTITQVPPVPLPPPPPLIPNQQQQQPFGKDASVLQPSPEQQHFLLPPVAPHLKGRKCLVLDLDETLVHSSFKILNQADFTIPVEIEGQFHNVYVIKRPGVDQFMKRVGELYEVVVFTASVSKYGDPLLDQLDIHHVVHHRLFRESCYNHQGNYVKVSPLLDPRNCTDA